MKTLSFILCFLVTTPALSQESIKKGVEAPYDGIILTEEEAVKILSSRKVSEEECEILIEESQAIEKNKCDLAVDNLKADLKAEEEKTAILLRIKDREVDRLYREVEKPDYTGPAFAGGIAVGVIVAAVAAVAIFYAAVQTAKSPSIFEN